MMAGEIAALFLEEYAMKPNRWDCFVIAIVLLCGILLMILPAREKTGERVVISLQGKTYAEAPLEQDAQISVDEKLTVIIQGGVVSVTDAICSDLLCEKHKPISRGGESIVCLPSKISVSIEGKVTLDAIAE